MKKGVWSRDRVWEPFSLKGDGLDVLRHSFWGFQLRKVEILSTYGVAKTPQLGSTLTLAMPQQRWGELVSSKLKTCTL